MGDSNKRLSVIAFLIAAIILGSSGFAQIALAGGSFGDYHGSPVFLSVIADVDNGGTTEIQDNFGTGNIGDTFPVPFSGGLPGNDFLASTFSLNDGLELISIRITTNPLGLELHDLPIVDSLGQGPFIIAEGLVSNTNTPRLLDSCRGFLNDVEVPLKDCQIFVGDGTLADPFVGGVLFDPALYNAVPVTSLTVEFRFANLVERNIPPSVDAGPDTPINEGDGFSSAGSFIDDDSISWSATVDYGDGSGPIPLPLNPDNSFALSHTYTNNGVFTVTVIVTDDSGDSGSDTVTVTVNDVAPILSGPDSFNGIVGDPTTFNDVTCQDPADDSPYTLIVDPGDGTDPFDVNFDNCDGTPITIPIHIYNSKAQFTATLIPIDTDNISGTPLEIPVSIENPLVLGIAHVSPDPLPNPTLFPGDSTTDVFDLTIEPFGESQVGMPVIAIGELECQNAAGEPIEPIVQFEYSEDNAIIGPTSTFTAIKTARDAGFFGDYFCRQLIDSDAFLEPSSFSVRGAIAIPDVVTVSFSSAGSVVGEDVGTHAISVELHTTGGTISQPVTVDVVDLLLPSATSGLDYDAFPTQTLTFPTGSPDGSTMDVFVTIIDDMVLEDSETMVLQLQNPTNALIVSPDTHELEINENEIVFVEFVLDSSSVDEDDGSVSIGVELLGPPGVTLGVPIGFDVLDLLTGSGVPGVDYVPFTPHSMIFLPDTPVGFSDELIIEIINNGAMDGDRTIDLGLEKTDGPDGVTIGEKDEHEVTIFDDDDNGTAIINGFKFIDLNGNGVLDPSTENEGGNGWTIKLNCQNGHQDTKITSKHFLGADGFFEFINIPAPTTCTVSEVLMPGWEQTFPPFFIYTLQVNPGDFIDGVFFGNHQSFVTAEKYYTDNEIDIENNQFGNRLPIDPESGKYSLDAIIQKNGKVASYNPGKYNAVTEVRINQDMDKLEIDELFHDCTDREPSTGPNISKFNPQQIQSDTKVVLIREGEAFDLTAELISQGDPTIPQGLFWLDNNGNGIIDYAEVHIEDLTKNDIVLFYVTFSPGLKGEIFDPEANNMCHNEEIVTFEPLGGIGSSITVEADLVVLDKKNS